MLSFAAFWLCPLSFKGVKGLKQALWHFILEVLGLLKSRFVSYDKFKDTCGTGCDIVVAIKKKSCGRIISNG